MKSVPSGSSAHVTQWEASWEQGTLHYSRWFPFPGQVAQGEKINVLVFTCSVFYATKYVSCDF